MSQRFILVLPTLLIIGLSFVTVEAQQAGFTYQGKLTDNGSPANGNYDLQFALFDSASGGTQIGQTQTVANVTTSSGVFTVTLDFGATAFPGATRFLEISTRVVGGGAFTLLTPRQQISSTPYAVRSLSSGTADLASNAQQLGGAAAAQYVQTNDSRLSDARPPTTGSSNYIQNTTSPQTESNFNISGNGTAAGTLSGNLVNAGTQYNINGSRVLAVTGDGPRPTINTFAGVDAGKFTTPQPTGEAGLFNSFFGAAAGFSNMTGGNNSFFGAHAGVNSSGNDNSFFGSRAGVGNTSGSSNTFLGKNAGTFNSLESFNTFVGAFARGTTNVNNATAIGYLAHVTQSNSLVLGGINGVNGATADTNVGIGTTSPAARLHVNGNTLVMNGDMGIGTSAPAARLHVNGNTLVNGDVGIGTTTPNTATGGRVLHILGSNSALGLQAQLTGGQRWEWQSTVISGNGAMNLSNISNGTNPFTVLADGNVGIGTTLPTARLQVAGSPGTMASFGSTGDFAIDSSGLAGGRFVVKDNGDVGIGWMEPSGKLDVNGDIRFSTLGAAGSAHLCRNNLNQISSCSSSLRYKTSVHPFTSGLNLINRLQPITFKWKADQSADLGLAAEDVAAIEPLLVTHNVNGEVEGVKYDRLSAVFINTFKEQQSQIEQQQNQIRSLLEANTGLSTRLRTIERRLRKLTTRGGR